MDYVLDNVGVWKDRFINNGIKSFQEMTAQRWIRIIVIVGAYLLIRPYLLKGAENSQKRAMQKEAEALGLDSEGPNANDLRGRKKKSDEGKSTDVDSKPKTRSRKA